MKTEPKPIFIGLAVVGVILLLGGLYKVFLSEPPIPAAVTREEEMKHKGMNAQNYAASNQAQYANQPRGGTR
jgi:hypothetical protein